jgi:hypothetical protein
MLLSSTKSALSAALFPKLMFHHFFPIGSLERKVNPTQFAAAGRATAVPAAFLHHL